MSLVDRCWECDELTPRCRCNANPNPIYRPGFHPGLIDIHNPPELRPENKEGWTHGTD